jgi:septal ring factor EnvC (AmiA/AmiB activator)
MRLSVSLLRDLDRERREKEKAEAPTVPTEEQVKRAKESKDKHSTNGPTPPKRGVLSFGSVWRRKFRPLPEAKAVDLFADVVGDAFILGVAGGLIIYEYWKASKKPDVNRERIEELNERFEELKKREEELHAAEEENRQRFQTLEEALRALKDPRTKQPLLPSLQSS